MTKDEALKLALEALAANEFALMKVGQRGNGLHIQTTQAITAIKEALAQPSDSVEKPVNFELAYGEIYKDQRAALAKALAQMPELCKYGNETKSCTSAPMNCQCTHDAVFN